MLYVIPKRLPQNREVESSPGSPSCGSKAFLAEKCVWGELVGVWGPQGSLMVPQLMLNVSCLSGAWGPGDGGSVVTWPELPGPQLQPHQEHWRPEAPCEAKDGGEGSLAPGCPGGMGPKGTRSPYCPSQEKQQGLLNLQVFNFEKTQRPH